MIPLLKKHGVEKIIPFIAISLILIALGVFVYQYINLTKEITEAKTLLSQAVESYGTKITHLQQDLALSQNRNTNLSETLVAEQSKNAFFSEQIKVVAGTVANLDKLSKTDKELLQKYSKIYFLNENYIPEKLSSIKPEHLYYPERTAQIHTQALPFLERLLASAANDKIDIQVISAYRSFGEQSLIKSNYTFLYGAGSANQFSADQGYSEHQLGTTLDFTTSETGANFSEFENSPAYAWLKSNAHLYGFTLSYPENNSYYEFEPWHWRFVGVELATRLRNESKHFYDFDQREIDKYLIKIFDQP